MSASLVIMAAGLGSRYGGIKQMEGVGPHGEILMEYAIYDALAAGFDHIVVILRPDIYDDFRARFGARLEKHVRLSYAIQSDRSLPDFYTVPQGRSKPYGTIHAVLCARDLIDGSFAVLNADDYYGRDAFATMRRALDELRSAADSCMVAYQLKNTVSPNGAVTRGVCEERDGWLASIRETSEIRPGEGGVIVSPGGVLNGDGPVSMNFWGFTREALADMDAYFTDFLRSDAGAELKSECLIPIYVADRLREAKLAVRMLVTGASWFGMTYHEDRAETSRRLLELHGQGAYPSPLFPD